MVFIVLHKKIKIISNQFNEENRWKAEHFMIMKTVQKTY